MRSKNKFLVLWVTFFVFLAFFSNSASAQQGSIYFSAGYNTSWYGRSTINIEQDDLGNSYNMVKVSGRDNKKNSLTTLGAPLQLSYRLGFFYNDEQTYGMEISFDPVNYAIMDNQDIQLTGFINNTPGVNKTLLISRKNGSYYYLDNANLFLINLVRRFQVFNDNAKKIRVDLLGKAGVGPALPHFESSLPINSFDNPQFTWSGWNVGGEAALRITLYRYAYFEFAARYDHSSFSNMQLYDGTAKQNLNTFELTGSFGFTFPTHRPNPLFTKDPRIITLLPFYQHRDEIGKQVRKKKVKTNEGEGIESIEANGMQDIPEFQEILDRKYKKEHPDTLIKVPLDSIENNVYLILDSTGKIVGPDSLVHKDSVLNNDTVQQPVHLTKREIRKKKKLEEKARKEQEPQVVDSLVHKDSVLNNDTVQQPVHLAKRELRKKKKLEEKEKEKKALEGLKPETKEPEFITPEVKEPEVKEPKEPEAKTPEAREPDKKEPVVSDQPKKEPELSKKEQRKKEKEDRKANKKKAREERRAKKNKKTGKDSQDTKER